MRTATRPNTARRAPRGPACDDRPRLWGDEPAAPAPASTAAIGAASVEAPLVPAATAPVASAEAPALPAAAAPAAPAESSITPPASAGPAATLVTDAPASVAAPAPSLEDLISGTWDGLVAGEAVTCPVCTEPMLPRWSAGAGVVGGRCGGCGTTLE